MNKQAFNKFDRDSVDIANRLIETGDKVKSLGEAMLLHLEYIRKVVDVNGRFPTEGESRDMELLTEYMKEKWVAMRNQYNRTNSPKKLILTCSFRSPRKPTLHQHT